MYKLYGTVQTMNWPEKKNHGVEIIRARLQQHCRLLPNENEEVNGGIEGNVRATVRTSKCALIKDEAPSSRRSSRRSSVASPSPCESEAPCDRWPPQTLQKKKERNIRVKFGADKNSTVRGKKTYQSTQTAKPKHPSNSILPQVRMVVHRIIINVRVDRSEDRTRDKRHLTSPAPTST